MKIFGREPAVYVGLIEGILAMLLSLNQFDLTHENIALIMAVVVALFGIYTAYVTRDTMLGVGVGLAKAVLALAIGYGWEPGPDVTAAAVALVALVIGFFQRTQTSPLNIPSFARNPGYDANPATPA